MKRPAMEETESTTPRTRRRLDLQVSYKSSEESLPASHAAVLTDNDERQSQLTYGRYENYGNENRHSIKLLNHERRTNGQENGIIKFPSPSSVEEDQTDSTRSSRPPRRPLPRLKIKPLRQPSPLTDREGKDLALLTPNPTSLRPPPCTPTDGTTPLEEPLQTPQLILATNQSGKVYSMVDLSKLPPSPVSITQLFEPEHHPPTPPYYVQDFLDPTVTPYGADSETLAESVPNANTYLRKGRFQRGKKGKKSSNTWAFRDTEAYPRGETPILETYLDEAIGPLDLIAMGLTVKAAPVPREIEESEAFTEEEEAEISRDPGLPVTLAVGIDDKGRYVCKWGGCDKTFARNDHLGRHVKVTHLRVRKHRCEPCGLAFVGIKGLRAHEKTHVVVKAKDDSVEPMESSPSSPQSKPKTRSNDPEPTSLTESPEEDDEVISVPDTLEGPKLDPETEGDDGDEDQEMLRV